MDLKGSIVDNKIKIIPSQLLVKYIKNLPLKDDMPTNIAKIIKGLDFEACEPISEKKNIVDFDLTRDELAFLSTLNKGVGPVMDNELSSEKPIANVEKSTEIKENKQKATEEKCTEVNKDIEKAPKKNYSIHLMVTDMEWLYVHLKVLRTDGATDIPYLHELLEGSSVETPENAVLKRNPELEARCVKLRAQQEAREYRAMTKGVDNVRKHFPEDSISYQLKQLNRQMIAIGQFLLSIFAGFLFGFKGIELMIGSFDFGLRLLLGVMCALIIALAEIYFLAKKLNEELNIPETTQLGGPVKFANMTQQEIQSNVTNTKSTIANKEHND